MTRANLKIATELEWLRWFYQSANFGPADSDVRDAMVEQFTEQTGKAIPKAYQREDE